MRRPWLRTFGGLVFATVVVGCTPAADDPNAGDQPTPAATEVATEPPIEQPTIESPEDGDGEIALELPGLPIGGASEVVSDTLQCVDVNWSDPPSIPETLQIRVAEISVEPPDAYALSDEPCPGDQSVPCASPGFAFRAEGLPCTVAVTWRDRTVSQPGSLFVSAGVVTCPPDSSEVCTQFRDAVVAGGGEGIELHPAPSQPPDEDETDEPTDEDETDEPTDEPTGEATDEPTGDPTG